VTTKDYKMVVILLICIVFSMASCSRQEPAYAGVLLNERNRKYNTEPWFRKRIDKNLTRKSLCIWMTADEVMKIWGRPRDTKIMRRYDGTYEIWSYDRHTLYFADSVLYQIYNR